MARFFARLFSGKLYALMCVLAGGFAALGHAPWSLWYVALVAMSAMCVLFLRAPDSGRSAGAAWLSGTGYFAVALFWIVEPFLVDAARHGWMAPFALLFLAGGLALLWAIAGGIAGRFVGSRKAVAFVLALSLIEMLRGVLFTGFPWALISYIWSDHAIMQIAAWIGPFGLAAITLSLSMLLGIAFNERRLIPGITACVLLAGLWGGGAARLAQGSVEDAGKTVRLLQPNAAQHLKWDPDMVPVFFSSQLDMTRGASAANVDLVVWPETAVGYRLKRRPEALEYIADAAAGVPVIFGGNSAVDDTLRNTLASMGPNGEIRDWYYKHHLVPFGEYIPLGSWLGDMGIRGLAARDGGGFSAGDGPQILEVPEIGRILPLICYELIFPRHMRTETRPDLILQLTNDAWFGEVSGPYQHLAQAQFRAVEQGLPVLRSANTGISAAIDPYGRVTDQLELGRAGFLDVELTRPLKPGFYARWGDWPIVAVLMVAFATLAALGRGHERDT
ncbi:MAG: apolipoprotein N-acyltransferase [Litoreibacter sp.]